MKTGADLDGLDPSCLTVILTNMGWSHSKSKEVHRSTQSVYDDKGTHVGDFTEKECRKYLMDQGLIL